MGKYRTPFANNDVIHIIEQNKEPEQKLWIAVLAKAFDDAFYCTDERAALEALSWIKHGGDFNYVCHLSGRNGGYVKAKMINKVIQREATILDKKQKIKKMVNNVIMLKQKIPPKITYKKKKLRDWKKDDYEWLPKQTHDYVER